MLAKHSTTELHTISSFSVGSISLSSPGCPGTCHSALGVPSSWDFRHAYLTRCSSISASQALTCGFFIWYVLASMRLFLACAKNQISKLVGIVSKLRENKSVGSVITPIGVSLHLLLHSLSSSVKQRSPMASSEST